MEDDRRSGLTTMSGRGVETPRPITSVQLIFKLGAAIGRTELFSSSTVP